MAAHGRVRHDIRLTPSQAFHERLMKEVLSRVIGLDLVLKGGGALAFTRGLNRHSTDLDFDTDRASELQDRIETAARCKGRALDRPNTQHLRWPRVQEQRVPVPIGILGRVFAIRNRALVRSQGGLRFHSHRTGGDQGPSRAS